MKPACLMICFLLFLISPALAAEPPKTAQDACQAGLEHLAGKKFQEAITCFDRALEADPRLVEAWDGKGNALRGLQHFDEALRCYDRALGLKPDSAVAWKNRGLVLESMKKYRDVLTC